MLALDDAHVIRQELARGRKRYRLVDPFLAEWLAVSQGG